jgi:Uma2 family endonuclease
MGQAAAKALMSGSEFLDWEQAQTERHEFVEGQIVAMAGAEARHVVIAMNAAMALRQHLKGSSCRTFMSDMKVQSQDARNFFYPDVLVTCGESTAPGTLVMRQPLFVVEVLSPSTAAYDRGAKFAHYRRFDSLKEVAFIDPDTRRTDVFRRGADGLWVLHAFEPGETVRWASVDLSVSADELFADVDEAPPASAAE